MIELIQPYQWSVLFLGLTGALSIVQLLVFDWMAIRLKHPPGYPIEHNHQNLLFRVSRAHANTNETMGAMILLFIFVLFSGGDARWTNSLMGLYLSCRVLHMVCYYAGWSLFRGVVFGFSLLALASLFVLGLISWF